VLKGLAHLAVQHSVEGALCAADGTFPSCEHVQGTLGYPLVASRVDDCIKEQDGSRCCDYQQDVGGG